MSTGTHRSTLLGEAWEGVRTGRSAGGIYGLLIALSVVTAMSLKDEPSTAVMAGAVAGSGLVFWIAHVHAHLVAEWIRTGTSPPREQVRAEMVAHLPIVVAAMPAAIVLTLSDFGLYGTSFAVWTVLLGSLLLLAGWGLAMARLAHMGPLAALFIGAVNVSMGAAIVLLKVAVSY